MPNSRGRAAAGFPHPRRFGTAAVPYGAARVLRAHRTTIHRPMSYNTIVVEEKDGVMSVTLNRPDVHNAFNDELIAEAIDLFTLLLSNRTARAVVLRSEGASFCAGADLNWMARMVAYTRDE